MKKLIVTIPAYNEEASIAEVIKSIPRKIEGIDKVEVMVLSDGSTDKTMKVARKAGADHVLENPHNMGLAKTFSNLMQYAYEAGADYVVNTDADNQYDQSEIPKLVKPLTKDGADMVLGNRQVSTLGHMPLSKKIGNIIGSWTIRMLSGTKVIDASTGFRGYSRRFLKSLHLFSSHTYTHETIVFAANHGMKVVEVPIIFRVRTNGQSRLIGNIWTHIQKSGLVIMRSVLMYNAYKFLVWAGALISLGGVAIGVRYIYLLYIIQSEGDHVQSLILASILISIGFTTIITGVLADLIKINRILLEDITSRIKDKS
jgi:glycosyltransferase involved in cell wall biosynthesis